jgi:hypothetical protein
MRLATLHLAGFVLPVLPPLLTPRAFGQIGEGCGVIREHAVYHAFHEH